MNSLSRRIQILSCYVVLLCNVPTIGVAADEGFPVPISSPKNPSLPDSWINSDVQGKVSAIPETSRDNAERTTRDLLRRYPNEVLEHTVKHIYLVGDLSFYGRAACGTYWDYDLFIAAGSIFRKHDQLTLKRTLHHEISSLIKWRFEDYFPTNQWKLLNPKGFEYSTDRQSAREASTEIDEQLSRSGFLCQYSKQSLEDDFNMIVENMLEPTEEFYRILERCELIRAKCRLAENFYVLVHPDFQNIFSERVQLFLQRPGISKHRPWQGGW